MDRFSKGDLTQSELAALKELATTGVFKARTKPQVEKKLLALRYA